MHPCIITIWKDVPLSWLSILKAGRCIKSTSLCRNDAMHTHALRVKPMHGHVTRPAHMSVDCVCQRSGAVHHLALVGSLDWSSMTFKVTPVCGLKHSRTNGSDKGCFHFGWHNPAAIRRDDHTDGQEGEAVGSKHRWGD